MKKYSISITFEFEAETDILAINCATKECARWHTSENNARITRLNEFGFPNEICSFLQLKEETIRQKNILIENAFKP